MSFAVLIACLCGVCLLTGAVIGLWLGHAAERRHRARLAYVIEGYSGPEIGRLRFGHQNPPHGSVTTAPAAMAMPPVSVSQGDITTGP